MVTNASITLGMEAGYGGTLVVSGDHQHHQSTWLSMRVRGISITLVMEAGYGGTLVVSGNHVKNQSL